MSEHKQVHDEQGEPDGVRVLLHAAAFAVTGAVCHGFGELFGRIVGWVTVHVCNAEERWIHRGTSWNQRAFRIIRPRWESAERFARQRAERGNHHD